MKAARWYNAKDIRVEEIPEPKVAKGQVKIKVAYCGICGSDLHEYLVGPIFIPVSEPHPLSKDKAPIVMGHEYAGEVVEIGEDVTNVKVGDRVCVEPIYSCGECVSCKKGHYNVCGKLGFIGLSGGYGGYGEYSVVPVNMVHKIPEQMSWEQAALVEPTAVAVHAVRQSTLKIGDTVAVFGTGPIGLLVIQAARAAGASKIIATEVSPERQEFAKKIGADIVINPLENDVVNEIKRHTDGLGVDVSFEVAGVNSTLNTAIQSTKREGNVVNISIWENTANIPLNNLILTERQMTSIIAYRNIFPNVIQLIANGQIKALDLVTKIISLDEIVSEGFEALTKNKNQIKILVNPFL
ncbi:MULTISPECIES: 2,3-butanediol dehydrogenase [Geobacillus]|uniref:2,3-butanediol dehydrogenase n=1 Tax=Geobacillus zalihae TaxID=213419 RepID=A0A7H1RWI4_9BACL|nr:MULTISPECIES: 2,3-butanediol dehydrogenase [Geobacillus]EPR30176.1 (R,R)-butanediol dehydrogenase [Geobacillus sp. WSUCF1]OQP17448.1 butanediol dehydrogenase [Geobacillus zalihae]OQP24490.1 butanediol dehydrogenase [Geobacillus zalihae]QNU18623.1 2,3-butanediol dehydrogenase [Geobacillus zalihae]